MSPLPPIVSTQESETARAEVLAQKKGLTRELDAPATFTDTIVEAWEDSPSRWPQEQTMGRLRRHDECVEAVR
jgi:hypothetical protein